MKNYTIVKDLKTLKGMLDSIGKDSPWTAFDIETNGIVEKTSEIIGIGTCSKPGTAFYIPLAEWNAQDKSLDRLYEPSVEQEIVHLLISKLRTSKLIMHNGVFDIACMWHYYKIDLTDYLYADTILMKHTLDEMRPFGLKPLAEKYYKYLGLSKEEATQEQGDLKESVVKNGGSWTKNTKDMYMADVDIIGKYGCADVDLTLRLFGYLDLRLKKEDLSEFFYHKEVMPLYKKATIPMRFGGIYVDIPYFKELEKTIESDIIRLTDEIFGMIEEKIKPKIKEILDGHVKVSKSGAFAEKVLQFYKKPVPLNESTGKPTFAKKALQSLEAEHGDNLGVQFLCGNAELPPNIIYKIKESIYKEKKPELPRIFNLSSNQHLGWLIFNAYGQTPTEFSKKTNSPKVDQNSLEQYSIPFIPVLVKLKKEEKILNTYVKPILKSHINGWLYPSFLQFGTTSGRYSCGGGINLQTLPRDDLRIKKGFIAPPGYKVVSADFNSLEPRIFSWACNDDGLKKVWREGLDLYSSVSIEVFRLKGCSADPKSPNFLKIKDPEQRQKSKTFSLAVVYGSGAHRIAKLMGVSPKEADKIIKDYLDAYPKLQDYMEFQEETAVNHGMVFTKFGRVRHLPMAKQLYDEYGDHILNKTTMAIKFLNMDDPDGRRVYEDYVTATRTRDAKSTKDAKDELFKYGSDGVDLYYKFRNALNNAKNFPIQSSAATVCNAALAKISDYLKTYDIDGHVALQVHDDITLIVREDQADFTASLLKDSMENNWATEEIDVPMLAEPKIANNLADAK